MLENRAKVATIKEFPNPFHLFLQKNMIVRNDHPIGTGQKKQSLGLVAKALQ